VTDDPETKSIQPSTASSMPSPEPASFQLNPGDRVGNYVIREAIEASNKPEQATGWRAKLPVRP